MPKAKKTTSTVKDPSELITSFNKSIETMRSIINNSKPSSEQDVKYLSDIALAANNWEVNLYPCLYRTLIKAKKYKLPFILNQKESFINSLVHGECAYHVAGGSACK